MIYGGSANQKNEKKKKGVGQALFHEREASWSVGWTPGRHHSYRQPRRRPLFDIQWQGSDHQALGHQKDVVLC